MARVEPHAPDSVDVIMACDMKETNGSVRDMDVPKEDVVIDGDVVLSKVIVTMSLRGFNASAISVEQESPLSISSHNACKLEGTHSAVSDMLVKESADGYISVGLNTQVARQIVAQETGKVVTDGLLCLRCDAEARRGTIELAKASEDGLLVQVLDESRRAILKGALPWPYRCRKHTTLQGWCTCRVL